jgi:hypothetical protein
MKSNFYPVLSLLLLFTVSVGIQAQVKKTIQLVFNPAEKFEIKNISSSEAFNGDQQAFKQKSSSTLLLNVIGKDTTGRVMMRAQYTKHNDRMEVIAQKEITGYNSEAPEAFIKAGGSEEIRNENQHTREFRGAMLNKPFTIYVDERSGSVKITGIDTLVTEALKNVISSNAEYLEGYSKGIRSVVNNEEMESNLEAVFNYLPGKPVGTGDGWTKNIKVEETDLKLGYIVKSIQSDSIGILAVAPPVVNNEYQVAVAKKGNLTIDARSGLLIHSTMRSEVRSVPGSGGQLLMINTNRYELVRVKQ